MNVKYLLVLCTVLFTWLTASSALAQCESGYVPCDGGCIPTSGTCCGWNNGKYCGSNAPVCCSDYTCSDSTCGGGSGGGSGGGGGTCEPGYVLCDGGCIPTNGTCCGWNNGKYCGSDAPVCCGDYTCASSASSCGGSGSGGSGGGGSSGGGSSGGGPPPSGYTCSGVVDNGCQLQFCLNMDSCAAYYEVFGQRFTCSSCSSVEGCATAAASACTAANSSSGGSDDSSGGCTVGNADAHSDGAGWALLAIAAVSLIGARRRFAK